MADLHLPEEGNHRRAFRLHQEDIGKINVEVAGHEVELLDLSDLGMGFRCDAEIGDGARAVLKFELHRPIQIETTVVIRRRQNDQYGTEFETIGVAEQRAVSAFLMECQKAAIRRQLKSLADENDQPET